MSDEEKKQPQDSLTPEASQQNAEPTQPEDAASDTPDIKVEPVGDGFGWSRAFAIIGVVALLVLAFVAYVMVGKTQQQQQSASVADPLSFIEQLNQELPDFIVSQAYQGKLVLHEEPEMVQLVRVKGSLGKSGEWLLDSSQVEKLRVPVVHTFVVNANDAWDVAIKGNVARVRVPPLKAGEMLRITGDIERAVGDLWRAVPVSEAATLGESLRAQVFARSEALLEEHRTSMEADARVALEDILLEWLLAKDAFEDHDFAAVKVVFPDVQAAMQPEAEVVEGVTAEEPEEALEAPAETQVPQA